MSMQYIYIPCNDNLTIATGVKITHSSLAHGIPSAKGQFDNLS